MATGTDYENMTPGFFKRKLVLSLVLPIIFVGLLWVIRFIESEFGVSLHRLGIYPLSIKGLVGIITSPFIHSDARHLFNNSLPLLALGAAIIYFYPQVALRVVTVVWLTTGIMVWFIGRDAWHIGASGLVYGLASFLFVSGIVRRYIPLLALSILVAYMYGSMVWGMFPLVYREVSWESHMVGALTGLVLALWYRKEGPQRRMPDWYYEEDKGDDEPTDPDDWEELPSDNN